MCAHAVRVALLKVPGVESVDISLERAIAAIRLRAGNSITLAQIREVVKNNGFTAKDATVTVVGSLVERGGKPALNVNGTNTLMLLTPDPKQPDAYKQVADWQRTAASATVEVSGVVETRTDQPDAFVVRGATVADPTSPSRPLR